MNKRFDRTPEGKKHHLQTLCALGHYDFNQAGGYSYEQAYQLGRRLKLDYSQLEELFRRAAFNVLTRNQDDHTKNISFMMDRRGEWHLSPAYDVTYSYNPSGAWTSRHQMTLNGKRDKFTLDDLIETAAHADVKPRKAKSIIEKIQQAQSQWLQFAQAAGIPDKTSKGISDNFRTF